METEVHMLHHSNWCKTANHKMLTPVIKFVIFRIFSVYLSGLSSGQPTCQILRGLFISRMLSFSCSSKIYFTSSIIYIFLKFFICPHNLMIKREHPCKCKFTLQYSKMCHDNAPPTPTCAPPHLNLCPSSPYFRSLIKLPEVGCWLWVCAFVICLSF